MLEVNNLSRFYGSTKAVDDVSFTIGTGEIVGLLGHNGAGKTTIMKMISGYLEPNSGSVTVDGFAMAEDTLSAQSRIGYLPENLPVYPEMTVGAYLDYAADIKGLKGNDKTQAVREAVLACDLGEKVLAPIATLSRGFRQRVGVAQAILASPKVLILDEPTNGLDPSQTHLMRELIRNIAKTATVILSTHIMQEVEALCDRVLIIDGGALKIDQALGALTQSQALHIESSLTSFELEALIAELPLFDSLSDAASTDSAPKALQGDPQQGLTIYLKNYQDASSLNAFASEVAKRVVSSGSHLYSLRPHTQDLETLFKLASTAQPTQGAQHPAESATTEENYHEA